MLSRTQHNGRHAHNRSLGVLSSECDCGYLGGRIRIGDPGILVGKRDEPAGGLRHGNHGGLRPGHPTLVQTKQRAGLDGTAASRLRPARHGGRIQVGSGFLMDRTAWRNVIRSFGVRHSNERDNQRVPGIGKEGGLTSYCLREIVDISKRGLPAPSQRNVGEVIQFGEFQPRLGVQCRRGGIDAVSNRGKVVVGSIPGGVEDYRAGGNVRGLPLQIEAHTPGSCAASSP